MNGMNHDDVALLRFWRWRLCQSRPARVQAKAEQRQDDTDEAKTETDQCTRIKEKQICELTFFYWETPFLLFDAEDRILPERPHGCHAFFAFLNSAKTGEASVSRNREHSLVAVPNSVGVFIFAQPEEERPLQFYVARLVCNLYLCRKQRIQAVRSLRPNKFAA